MSEEEIEKRKKQSGTVAIFVNERREKDTHPLLRGRCTINVAELWEKQDEHGLVDLDISLWGKKAQSGVEYWQGKIQPKYEGAASSNSLPPTTGATSDSSGEGSGDQPSADGAPPNDLPF